MNEMPRNTLKKEERLPSGKAISDLISRGRYVTNPVLKYIYSSGNGLPYNRIAVSVPKRLFRRAVKRNLLKRRIREAYRCHKALLPISGQDGGTDVLFCWNTKELIDFRGVTDAVMIALDNIAGKIMSHHGCDSAKDPV